MATISTTAKRLSHLLEHTSSINPMNENHSKTQGEDANSLFSSCFNWVLADHQLHDQWWHADALVGKISTRCKLADGQNANKEGARY